MINLWNSFRFGLHKLNPLSLSCPNDKFERWTRQYQQLWPHINEFYGKAYWGAREEASIYQQASIKGTIPGEKGEWYWKILIKRLYHERYCIIINNLPLVHGADYWEDVLIFFANYLNIKVERDSIVACHHWGRSTALANYQHSLSSSFTLMWRTEYGEENNSWEISLTRQMQNRSSSTND